MMTLKQALAIVGGLSTPSKMPCFSFSISALECNVGGVMRGVKGSTCDKCYAMRGNYRFQNVKDSHARRLAGMDNPLWVEAMTVAISLSETSGHFRWFDSGDVKSVAHLEKIIQVVKNLPNIQFWLPTREWVGVKGEKSILAQYVAKHGNIWPENLTVRLSALMLGGNPPVAMAKRFNAVTSTVSKTAYTCPASNQGNKCLSCRLCWNKGVANVAYHYH